MSDDMCLLVSVLYNNGIVKCAIKIEHGRSNPALEYLHEPEAHALISAALPLHVRNMGPGVNAEQIFEVVA